ncbi:hypothetical protein RVV18_000804 [Burkholderia ambifaria]|nr:hypothetical protein [Burkholderia ambifaria]
MDVFRAKTAILAVGADRTVQISAPARRHPNNFVAAVSVLTTRHASGMRNMEPKHGAYRLGGRDERKRPMAPIKMIDSVISGFSLTDSVSSSARMHTSRNSFDRNEHIVPSCELRRLTFVAAP